MAEGGYPLHELRQVRIENPHLHGPTNINDSLIGSAVVLRNDEGVEADAGSIQSDQPFENPTNAASTVWEPTKNDKDLAWLVKGKIAMYKNQPLGKGNKKVFYGKQQFFEHWREVAIKLIEHQDKNFQELNLLRELNHPNIVQIYDAGECRGVVSWIYIVMELCASDLRDYVDENPLDYQKSFSFAKQLAAGLVFLHKNKIVHRDLKPDNILISLCKQFIKLSDFGLSKPIPIGQTSATVTTVGAGTDGFRSPETYHPINHISFSVDIFPYGLVAHFVFTNGKHPYGSNPNEWSFNIMKNRNRDISSVPYFDEPNGHKRAQLLKLLDRTLQNNPRHRPTAKEIEEHIFFKDSDQIGEVSKVGSSMFGSLKKLFPSRKDDLIDAKTEENAAKIKRLESDLKISLKKERFQQSSQILEDLRQLRGSEDLKSLLEMTGCEMHLKRGNVNDSIQRVREFMTGNRFYSAQNAREMAEKLKMNKCYVQALILYRVSNDWHESEDTLPDDAAKWISGRILDIASATKPLLLSSLKSRDIGVTYGLQYMEKLLDDLRNLENVGPETKILEEARCLNNVSAACNDAGDYQKCIRLARMGVEVLENHFGADAAQYQYYGALLNNMGVAHENSELYEDAKYYFERALQAKQRATDFRNERKKVESMELTKYSLLKTRRLLDSNK